MTRKEYLKRKVLEHLIGPTGSIILHILIIYAAVHFIVFDTRETTSEVEAEIMEIQEVDLDEILEEIEPEFEPPDVDVDIEMPDMDVDVDMEPDPQDFAQDQPDVDFAALDVMQVDSPLTMQGLFSGRDSAGRAELLNRYGGRWGEATAAAVVKALQWLKDNQQEDGSWRTAMTGQSDLNHRIGITGLGLLAFLAHGETPGSEEYGRTVEAAIRYLVENQNDEGEFIDPGIKPEGAYSHAIATYAIAEAFALSRIPRLRDPMERGVEAILQGRNSPGMWGYGYDSISNEPINTSVSVWQLQALKAAELAGAANPDLQSVTEEALEVLLGRQAEDGEFFYRGVERVQDVRRPDHGLTAAAVLTFQLYGLANTSQARTGMNVLRDARVEWNRPEQWPMSRWYYVTQVKFQQGGSTWEDWNNRFAPEFVRSQNDDGSWDSPAQRDANVDIPFGYEDRFGPAFSTAMAALTLQVYYRILPTFAVVEEPEEEEEDDDDVVIQII